MPNRIQELFQKKPNNILSIFYTAGYPTLGDTLPIAKTLEAAGVDMVEVGIPFSDSLVDGPTIQAANEVALSQGMSIAQLMNQLTELRAQVSMPVVLMGCVNPILQYGIDSFCADCKRVGVDGIIVPDLPPEEYELSWKASFDRHDLSHIFLVTRHTSDERIRYLDSLSQGFLYAVSSEATTGGLLQRDDEREAFLERLKGLSLSNPIMMGFGISSRDTLSYAFDHCQGGIIGSAFIRVLSEHHDQSKSIIDFIGALK